ncbi:hypothetical protein C8N26_0037 [Tenacibaculum lutimaris]|uniref:SH3 domain-containing protein n=1 Tax=Tenacibaculum lutimaris TaxID=285258 RepID=A0A420E3I6_9FLAO|nr:hypothetical protein [Tenacibaculum lutimaris]RKF04652.1 hypothetical protein C8N26_0037 [Tenacibaculum lutimaris]
MKKTSLLILILLISTNIFCQTKIDSLEILINNLKEEKSIIDEKIKNAEKEIIKIIKAEGYEITVKLPYYKKYLEVKNKIKGGRIIAKIKDGEKLLVIGKEDIYLKVKIKDKIGFTFISNLEPPINLLSQKKEYYNSFKKNTTSNSFNYSTGKTYKSKCSSTQCTGRTKKGSRCRNRTTNCSGRCYRH